MTKPAIGRTFTAEELIRFAKYESVRSEVICTALGAVASWRRIGGVLLQYISGDMREVEDIPGLAAILRVTRELQEGKERGHILTGVGPCSNRAQIGSLLKEKFPNETKTFSSEREYVICSLVLLDPTSVLVGYIYFDPDKGLMYGDLTIES
jgi:hypothetical protein